MRIKCDSYHPQCLRNDFPQTIWKYHNVVSVTRDNNVYFSMFNWIIKKVDIVYVIFFRKSWIPTKSMRVEILRKKHVRRRHRIKKLQEGFSTSKRRQRQNGIRDTIPIIWRVTTLLLFSNGSKLLLMSVYYIICVEFYNITRTKFVQKMK